MSGALYWPVFFRPEILTSPLTSWRAVGTTEANISKSGQIDNWTYAPSRRRYLFSLALFFFLTVFFTGSEVYSGTGSDMDWKIVELDSIVGLQRPGYIVNGDTHSFFFFKKNCNYVEHVFQNLTFDTKKISNLVGTKVPIEIIAYRSSSLGNPRQAKTVSGPRTHRKNGYVAPYSIIRSGPHKDTKKINFNLLRKMTDDQFSAFIFDNNFSSGLIEKLDQKRILLRNDPDIMVDHSTAKVSGAIDFLMGKLVFLTFGIFEREKLLSHLELVKKLSIRLVDRDRFIASEYFHQPYNEWSFEGIEEEFSKAYEACTKATKWREA